MQEVASPFAFDREETAASFGRNKPIGLFKLKPGVRTMVRFGLMTESRLLVGIHWDKISGNSRRCAGSDRCADCDLGFVCQFHLYAAVYIQGSADFKAIVDLGTTLPKRWKLNPPDFNVPYTLWRKDKFGTVFADKREYDATIKSIWQGWDIRNDIDRLFATRTSMPKLGH